MSDTSTTAALSAVTVSAAGGSGTGGAATVPVTFVGGTTTQHLDASSFFGGSGGDTYSVIGDGNTFTGGDGVESFSSDGTGNVFVAGTASESFAATGSGVGDRIDFSALATSSSSPLTINVSGKLVGGVANDSASVATSVYSFTTGGVAFTSFTGATSGNTDFLASGTGGYRYVGHGTPNTLNLSAAPAGTVVTVNGNSLAQPGSVTKLTAGTSGATSDAFSDVQFFVGHVSILSPVKVKPPNLPHATVGTAYMQQLTGAGGVAPYVDWSVESGSLPPGLVLSSSGVLSGTPTVRGSFTFVVTLVDADNVPGATTLTLVVNPHMKP